MKGNKQPTLGVGLVTFLPNLRFGQFIEFV